jgi:broad specificity phosphatase PhoE
VAALLAREIARPRAVSLVCSSLGRAVDTAGIVGGAVDLPRAIDDRIIELSFGSWEGLTKEEMEAQTPGAFDGASRWDWYFRAPGGESFEQASARIGTWLGELRKPTIAVGHGLAGRILRGLYMELAREETLRQPIRRDGVFKLAEGGITFLEAPPIL